MGARGAGGKANARLDALVSLKLEEEALWAPRMVMSQATGKPKLEASGFRSKGGVWPQDSGYRSLSSLLALWFKGTEVGGQNEVLWSCSPHPRPPLHSDPSFLEVGRGFPGPGWVPGNPVVPPTLRASSHARPSGVPFQSA